MPALLDVARRVLLIGPIFVLLLFAGLASPRVASAQGCGVLCDETPPTVTVSGGNTENATVNVTITWCDDVALNANSREILLNGQDVSANFNYTFISGPCADNRQSTGSVTLSAGTNVIAATIRDVAGNLGTGEGTYVLANGFVVVGPKGLGVSRPQQTTALTQDFWVFNTGTLAATYKLASTCVNSVSACTAADTIRINAGDSAKVVVGYQSGSGAGSSGIVRLRARLDTDSTVADSADVTVTLATSLLVDASFNNNDAQNMSLCAHSCFANIYAVHAVGYTSMDGNRGVTLVHNSSRGWSPPALHVDVSFMSGSSGVNELTISVKDSATQGAIQIQGADANGYGAIHYARNGALAASVATRLTAVIKDAAWLTSHGTGIHPVTVTVTAVRTGYSESVALTIPVLVVRDVPGAVARGWYLAGTQRLLALSGNRVLITEADGSAFVYTKLDPSNPSNPDYASPSGEFSGLKRFGSGAGATHVRAYADSSKAWFDSTGRMVKMTDSWGNAIRYAYSTNGRPTRVHDPFPKRPDSLAAQSAYTEIEYASDSVIYIRPPQANGASYDLARVTTLRLTADSTLRAVIDPDGDSTRFLYNKPQPWPNHNRNVQLATVYDRNGNTVSFAYNGWTFGLKSTTYGPVAWYKGNGITENVWPWLMRFDGRLLPVPGYQTMYPWYLAQSIRSDSLWSQVDTPDGYHHYTREDRWGQIVGSRTENWLSDESQNFRSNILTRIYRSGLLADSVVEYMTRSINKANVLKTERIDRFGYGTVAGGRPVLVWSKVAGGDSLSYSYDSFGQVRSVDGPRTPEQVFYRSANPTKVDSVTTGGFTTRVHYDTLGRDTLITDAAGTGPSPGTSGVVSSVGHTTRKLYDTVFGNLSRVEEPGDRFSARTFDKYGRDSVVFSNGTARRYVTYDAIDRPVRDSLSADPRAVTYHYDREFLLRVTDAKGQVFRRDVNALGPPTRLHDPADTLGKYVSYFYDRVGHVASWTNQRLQRQDIAYDQLGRPLSTSHTGNFATDSWTYGYRYATYPIDSTTAVTGTFTVARNGVSVDTTWTDSFGWVDSVVTRVIANAPQGLNASIAQKRFVRYHVPTPDRQLDSTYYKAMAVGSSTNLIPFVSRRYVRDLATGATGTYVLGVSGVANNVNVSYDPNELIERYRDYPSSVRHSFAYTPRHEVAQSFYNSATLEAAFGRTYAFRDSLGRVTSMSWSVGPDTTNVRSFRFNDRGELVRLADSTVAAATCSFTGQDLLNGLSCTGGTAWPTRVLTFAYDSAGNLTGETDSLASTTTSATYTLGNRLTAFGTTAYTLDDDGNMASRTTGGVTTYFTYDGKSRLASVRVGADTTFYWYNANGELTVRARNNNSGTNIRTIERLFFWDGGQLVAETDAGMTTRYGEYAYLPGTDRPLALITTDSSVSGNTVVRYYQQDELGNVIGLTSGSTVAQQITYEPWGTVASITGGALADTSRLRWKGLLWEGGAAQMYYVRNRWYDPAARRFVTQDPIGVDGGLNQYAFAANDPLNGNDPLGLNPCPETALQQGWHTVTIDGKEWCYNGGEPLPTVRITTTQWQSGFSSNFGQRGGSYQGIGGVTSSAGTWAGAGASAQESRDDRPWPTVGACLGDDPGLPYAIGAASAALGVQLKFPWEWRTNASIWGSVDRRFPWLPGKNPKWGPTARVAGSVGRVKQLGKYGTAAVVVGGVSAGYIVGALGRCYLEAR